MLTRLVRGRRMCRSFTDEPVDSAVVDQLADAARRAPAAGNATTVELLVLETAADVARYWDLTLPADRRAEFPWPGLLDAPVLVVLWCNPDAYVARYGEPDKARTGLGVDAARWPVPYWFVDAGMAAMAMLLVAEAHGLGALFFGLFDHEPAIRAAFGVPADRRAVGVLAIGHPAQGRPSRSAARGRPDLADIVHRSSWGSAGGR